jgi:hypothetical protein
MINKTCDVIERTLGKSAAFRKVDDKLYVVHQGSAYVTISVLPVAPDAEKSRGGHHARPVVRIYARVVTGVRPEPSLLRQLMVLNTRMRFGAFAYHPDGNVILFAHSMLGGEEMDEKELLATVTDVALIADAYDDRIAARYGGMRMQDLVMDNALAHLMGVDESLAHPDWPQGDEAEEEEETEK